MREEGRGDGDDEVVDENRNYMIRPPRAQTAGSRGAREVREVKQ